MLTKKAHIFLRAQFATQVRTSGNTTGRSMRPASPSSPPEMDRKTGGLGLGLTLVKRLVEMHGGTASACSEGEGRGSELVVRLPLSTNSPLPAQALEVQALSTSADSWKRRIVLVEDSEDVREAIALVDLGLAGIDGFELARRARAAPGGDQLCLVSLSGYGGPEAKAKAEGAGFNLHLTKPVDSDLLSLVVSAAKAPLLGAPSRPSQR